MSDAPRGDGSETPHAKGTRRLLLRSAGVMTAFTLLSRVLGLVREQVRSYFLGTGRGSDAFGLASTIPNLLRRLFAEGATTAAFVPVFTETKHNESREELWRFASRFLTLLTAIVAAVTCLGILLSPWIVETFFSARFQEVPGKVALTIVLTQLMFPYLLLISVAAVFQGILNTFQVFAPSAFTPVLLNLAIIGCAAALSPLFPDPSYAFAIGFLVGGVLQLGFQVPFAWRVGARLRPHLRCWTPRVRHVLRIMGPGVLAAGIYQVNVFVSQLVASGLHRGSVASLQFSVRLQELVLGVFVISLATVILPTLSRQLLDDDSSAARGTLRFTLGLLGLVTVPATVGLILLGPDIVRLLFQHGAFTEESTRMTAFALVFHALGIYPIAVGRVVQQGFFAQKNLRTPMYVAAVSMVVNVVFCFLLPGLMAESDAHGGVAAAGAVAAVVNAAGLVFLLGGRLGGLGFGRLLRSLLRIGLAAAGMAGLLLALETLWPWDAASGRLLLAARIAVATFSGAVVFYVLARLLRCPELTELRGLLRRKLRR